ncbi:hypothetical protein ACRRTK_009897 [Alexandromys fortis]
MWGPTAASGSGGTGKVRALSFHEVSRLENCKQYSHGCAVVWTHWRCLLEEASLTCGKWHLELRVALDSALPAEE